MAKPSPLKLSLGIVTHNHSTFIVECIESLFRTQEFSSFDLDVFIFDNASTDGTVELLKNLAQRYPKLRVDFNSTNLGFGAAHNKILARASGRIHFICNPDVIFIEPVLYPMAEFLRDHPDVGLLAPKVCFPDGSWQNLNRRDPRLLDLMVRRLGLGRLHRFLGERVRRYEMQDRGPDETFDVEFISGCFMAARADLLRDFKGFDERYFAYFEDADLSRRVRHAGLRVLFWPKVRIHHHWRRENRKKLRATFIFISSAFQYFRKWGCAW